MPLHPEARGVVAHLQAEVSGAVIPACGAARAEREAVARAIAPLTERVGALGMRKRGEQLGAEARRAARGSGGGGALKTEVALGARLVRYFDARHVAHKAGGADARRQEPLFGAHVAHGAAQAVGLLRLRLIGATWAQCEVRVASARAERAGWARELRACLAR